MSEPTTDIAPIQRPEAYRDTLRQAVDRWGLSAQLLMAVEECGELQTAIGHLFRDRADKDDLAEEVADVIIMCWQLAEEIGEDRVGWAIQDKMGRLQSRLENPANRDHA